jgi:hypothetical protein
MSALDVLRSFAEAREPATVIVRDGITYGHCRDILAELDRLRKENATCCLQLLDRCFIGTTEEGLADLEQAQTDPAVVALVQQYQDRPLDTCTRCARPAPVDDDGICAWGCPA